MVTSKLTEDSYEYYYDSYSDDSHQTQLKPSGDVSSSEMRTNPVKPTSTWRLYLINRYSRSFAVYLGLLLTASSYSNWQPMFLILNDMGAYAWMCDDSSSHEDDFATCDEQYDYLSQIYTLSGTMSTVSGLLGGLLMDTIGGRYTMALGAITCYAGWLMLIFSSESTPMYWPGLLALGLAENFLGFPGFLVGDFWPRIKDTCASLCIAMQMLSSWMPAVLWSVVKVSTSANLGKTSLGYYLVIAALPTMLMIVATPGNSSEITKMKKAQIAAESSSSKEIATASNVEALEVTTSQKNRVLTLQYWKDFGRILFTIDFILFIIWYVLFTLGFSYYNTKIMSHAGKEIGELIGILNPFRALMGPCMGVMSDWLGAFPMIILDNVLIAVAFGIALIPNDVAYRSSAVLYILARSFCFTTKYIFVQNFYPKEHFGKLSGIISIMGGLFGMLNTWFVVLPYDTQDTFAVGCAALSVLTVIPLFMLLRDRRMKQQKVIDETFHETV